MQRTAGNSRYYEQYRTAGSISRTPLKKSAVRYENTNVYRNTSPFGANVKPKVYRKKKTNPAARIFAMIILALVGIYVMPFGLKNVFFPKFYGNESPCFAPYKFKELVGELNPLFSGIAANDAKDLLQFILERMHSELKMAMQYFSDYNIDQTNELQSKQYFYQSYVFQNNSPFLSYLFGIIKIQTKCLKCNIIKYNFQSYNLLYFPLKESKKFAIVKKKEENKDFNEDNYILNLEDCFMYNEKVEYFTGDNSMYCNICNSLQDANYQSMLYCTPIVLAIVLNRGRGNLDFQEKFIFGTELNIEKYLHNEEKKGKYYLMSMVVHFGESNMSGHFMAYCRMDKDSKWFCYNDAFVSECKNFEQIMEKGTPYILFYHQE